MAIHDLPTPTPASNDSVIQLLRMFLDLAFDKKVTYIEITAIADGKKDSISIST